MPEFVSKNVLVRNDCHFYAVSNLCTIPVYNIGINLCKSYEGVLQTHTTNKYDAHVGRGIPIIIHHTEQEHSSTDQHLIVSMKRSRYAMDSLSI